MSVRDGRATYWGDPHIVSLVVMFVPQRSFAFATQTDPPSANILK